jgi:hypothetical protein
VDDSVDEMARVQVFKSPWKLQRDLDSDYHSKQTYFFRKFKYLKGISPVLCPFGCGREFKEYESCLLFLADDRYYTIIKHCINYPNQSDNHLLRASEYEIFDKDWATGPCKVCVGVSKEEYWWCGGGIADLRSKYQF